MGNAGFFYFLSATAPSLAGPCAIPCDSERSANQITTMICHIEIPNLGVLNRQVIHQLVDPFEAQLTNGVVALTRDPKTDLARFSFHSVEDDGSRNVHGCPFPGLLVREPACAELLRGSLLEFLVSLKRRPHLNELHAAN